MLSGESYHSRFHEEGPASETENEPHPRPDYCTMHAHAQFYTFWVYTHDLLGARHDHSSSSGDPFASSTSSDPRDGQSRLIIIIRLYSLNNYSIKS